MDLLTTVEKNNNLFKFKFPSNGNVAQAFNKYVATFKDNALEEIKKTSAKRRLMIAFINELISDMNAENPLGFIFSQIDNFNNVHQRVSNIIKHSLFIRGDQLLAQYPEYHLAKTVAVAGGTITDDRVFSNISDSNKLANMQKALTKNGKIDDFNKEIFILCDKQAFWNALNYNHASKISLNYWYLGLTKAKESYDYVVTPKEIVFSVGKTATRLYPVINVKDNFINNNALFLAVEKLAPLIQQNGYSFKDNDDISTVLLLKALVRYIKYSSTTYKKLESKFEFTCFYEPVKRSLMQLSTTAVAIKQEADYENSIKRDYATSFVDLKNNTQKAIQTAKASSFSKYFDYVELDGSGVADSNSKSKSALDYNKFEMLSQAFPKLFAKLPSMANSKPTLRFRKLGHHHATGLYYSIANCICIDVRDTSSFVHEYGHYLDYKKYHKASLNNLKFIDLVSRYTQYIRQQQLSPAKIKYYSTPTEVFARAFEIYMEETKHFSQNKDTALFAKNSFSSIEYQFLIQNKEEIIKLMSEIVK